MNVKTFTSYRISQFVFRFVSSTFIIFHLYTAFFGILSGLNQRIVHLGFALFLTFLLKPLSSNSEGKKAPFLFDWLLVFLALIITIYGLLESEAALNDRPGMVTNWDTLLGICLLILLLEASRRVLGWVLPFLAVMFVLYAHFGYILPSFLGHPGYDYERIIQQLYLSTEGIFNGEILGASAVYIALFLIFGSILATTGGTEFFANLALGLIGHVRGGPAKVAVFGSALFGMISGSGAADVAATGVITIPLMKRCGYSGVFAGAVEATASSGGKIMPPIMGSVAFIMAEFLGVSYSKVLLAALIPAILYFLAVFVSVDFEAAKSGLKGLNKGELPKVKEVLADGWPLIAPLIFLILTLSILGWSTTRSIFWTVIITIILSMRRKESRITLKKAILISENAVPTILTVALACAVAGVIMGVFNLTGLGIRVSNILVELSGGNVYVLLMLTMFASIFLGMGLPAVPCYVLLAVLVAPALIKMGVDPVASHMFIFYFGTLSNITPPVCIAVYTAAGISGESPMATGMAAVKIALAGFVLPYIFVQNPSMMFEKFVLVDFLLGVTSAIFSFIALSAGVFGYIFRPISKVTRLFAIIAALVLIDAGFITDLIGYAIFFFIVVKEYLAVKNYNAKKEATWVG